MSKVNSEVTTHTTILNTNENTTLLILHTGPFNRSYLHLGTEMTETVV